MKILAIDPGLTVGYSILEVEGDDVIDLLVEQERTNEKPYGTEPMRLLAEAGVDVLVMEDFVGAGYRTKESSYTLKMIGGFEFAAMERGIPVVMQTNIMRKAWIKDATALYRVWKEVLPCHHGKDALAHALRYLKGLGDIS